MDKKISYNKNRISLKEIPWINKSQISLVGFFRFFSLRIENYLDFVIWFLGFKSIFIIKTNILIPYTLYPYSLKIKGVTKITLISLLLFITLSLTNLGCCIYSFTGAAVPSHLKTIAIPIAEDRSGSGEPGLRELLTDQLIRKFIDDNTLQVSERTNADAILECTLTSLSDAPAVVTAGETVTARRITISVRVVYRDLVQRKVIFDKNFSNYGDYESGGGIIERSSAIETAVDRITEDILLDTVSGW
jgi:hypothetical protein